MSKLDLIVGLLVVFIIVFLTASTTRMFYNVSTNNLAPLGIRVTQWISFIGMLLMIFLAVWL